MNWRIEDTKKFIDQVVKDLDFLLDNTNIGIIDLDEKQTISTEDEDEKKSNTEKLTELRVQTAADLNKKIAAKRVTMQSIPWPNQYGRCGQLPQLGWNQASASMTGDSKLMSQHFRACGVVLDNHA